MRFEIRRHGIAVIPETKEDEAYIEDTLGLRRDGDAVLLRRRNAMGLSCIAFLETTAQPTNMWKEPPPECGNCRAALDNLDGVFVMQHSTSRTTRLTVCAACAETLKRNGWDVFATARALSFDS